MGDNRYGARSSTDTEAQVVREGPGPLFSEEWSRVLQGIALQDS